MAVGSRSSCGCKLSALFVILEAIAIGFASYKLSHSESMVPDSVLWKKVFIRLVVQKYKTRRLQ